MANRVDPDEMACYKPSHLELLYLQLYLFRSAGPKSDNPFIPFICIPSEFSYHSNWTSPFSI